MRSDADIITKVKVKDFTLFGVFSNDTLLESGNLSECMNYAESYAVATPENIYRIATIDTDGERPAMGTAVLSYFNCGDTVYINHDIV